MIVRREKTFAPDLRYIAENLAEREVIDSKHFSTGVAFAGKSYAMAYPDALEMKLRVRPGADNILAVFMGTHMCRLVTVDVTINGQSFELSSGTMSWFLGYDGYKRAEIEMPAELCQSGLVKVSVKARSYESSPFVPEIRTEVEFDGYKPRKDV